jgi:sulfate adenylyltransferase
VPIVEQTTTRPHGSLPHGSLAHGGLLVDRRLDAGEAAELAASRLPSLPLTAEEAAVLRALATGAYSPLTGFMGAEEHRSVLESLRLPDGTLWPTPVCLAIPDAVRLEWDGLLLRDQRGGLLGVLEVREVFRRDRHAEAELVYGTTDPAHPGVAAVLGAPSRAVAGPIRAVVAPLPGPLGGRVLTPLQTRAAFQARGWRSVVGYQPADRVRRSDRRLLRRALATVDGLLLQPLVGPTGEGAAAEACLRASEAVLGSLPPQRVLAAALLAPTRHSGPREALLHALVGKNHGCTHVLVGGHDREPLPSLSVEDLGVVALPAGRSAR